MDRITLTGHIEFDVKDITKKHFNQSEWKRMAMVFFGGDECEYYSWFLEKRYSLKLNKPLRASHISFINDSIRDISLNGELNNSQVNYLWNTTKRKWNGASIDVDLMLTPFSNDKHWWLPVSYESRDVLHSIRAEVNLGKPNFGLHMSIGYAKPDIHEKHSEYINQLIKIERGENKIV